MGMRAPTRLDVDEVLRVGKVGTIEDAKAAQPVVAHGIADTLRAAVGSAIQRLPRYEEQIAIHRDVALRPGAHEGFEEFRKFGIADIPYLQPVKVALDDIVAADRQVRIDEAEIIRVVAIDEVGRGRRVGY